MGAEREQDEIDDLARRFAAWMRRRGEYRWHPEIIGRQDVVGLEHLEAAREQGRGVLVSFLHHAHFEGSFLSLRRAGAGDDMQAIVHPLMISGGGGNFMRQHALVCALGGTLHSTEIGSPGIAGLLRTGRPVFIASDVKGRTPVRFLGQRRVGSSGAPRIAQQTGSPVVVMTFEQDGPRARVRLHEAIDPRAHPDPESLLEAMLVIHEHAVRAWPEAYDEPLKRWGVPAAGSP